MIRPRKIYGTSAHLVRKVDKKIFRALHARNDVRYFVILKNQMYMYVKNFFSRESCFITLRKARAHEEVSIHHLCSMKNSSLFFFEKRKKTDTKTMLFARAGQRAISLREGGGISSACV